MIEFLKLKWKNSFTWLYKPSSKYSKMAGKIKQNRSYQSEGLNVSTAF